MKRIRGWGEQAGRLALVLPCGVRGCGRLGEGGGSNTSPAQGGSGVRGQWRIPAQGKPGVSGGLSGVREEWEKAPTLPLPKWGSGPSTHLARRLDAPNHGHADQAPGAQQAAGQREVQAPPITDGV